MTVTSAEDGVIAQHTSNSKLDTFVSKINSRSPAFHLKITVKRESVHLYFKIMKINSIKNGTMPRFSLILDK